MEDAIGAEFGEDGGYVRKKLDCLNWDACVSHFVVGDRDEAVASSMTWDAERVDDLPPSIRFEKLVLFCCGVHSSELVLVGCYQIDLIVWEDFSFVKRDACWG